MEEEKKESEEGAVAEEAIEDGVFRSESESARERGKGRDCYPADVSFAYPFHNSHKATSFCVEVSASSCSFFTLFFFL